MSNLTADKDRFILDLLPKISDLILDTIFILDENGRVRYASPSCFQLLGYTQAELAGRLLIEFVVPEDRAKTWEEALQVMSGKPRSGFENRFLHKNGSVIALMWSARWSEEHRVRIGVARDVTGAKRQAAMQAATYEISQTAHAPGALVELYRSVHRIVGSLLSTAGFAVAVRHGDGGLDFEYQLDDSGVSPLLQNSLGRELCARALREKRAILESGQDGANNPQSWIAAPLATECEVLGVLLAQSHPGNVYGREEMELLHYVAIQVAAAIERKRLHADLVAAATRDELTGLPNRRLFLDRAEALLQSARRRPRHFALLYIDVDDFKSVNDEYGHEAGDALLREIAARLLRGARAEDTVARVGGDEFVVLLPAVTELRDALRLARKAVADLALPFLLPDGASIARGASIGVAVYPQDGEDIAALTRRADQRMFAAKRGDLPGRES